MPDGFNFQQRQNVRIALVVICLRNNHGSTLMFFSPASDLDLGAQATLSKARTQYYMILCPTANECLCREATKASINVP